MAEHKRPNWVRERAECEVRVVFNNLCKEVIADVATMKEYVERFFPPQAMLKAEQQATFMTVWCESDYADTNFVVKFNLDKQAKMIQVTIRAPDTPQEEEHIIKPAWNHKKECCDLLFDENPLEPWEVSKRVFSPLFFEHPGGPST